MTMKILEGSAVYSQKKQTPSGRKEVRHMDKELFQAIMEWLEIERQTQERLTEIRRELAKLAVSEQDVRF